MKREEKKGEMQDKMKGERKRKKDTEKEKIRKQEGPHNKSKKMACGESIFRKGRGMKIVFGPKKKTHEYLTKHTVFIY